MSDDDGNQENDSGSYSRRDFLRASGPALGAAAIGVAGTNSGCGGSTKEKKDDALYEWDEKTDVVVIGSGTGLAGALRAANDGMDVVVLEKADLPGGSTGISGGWAWVPNNPVMKSEGIEDSERKAKTYLRQLAYGQTSEAIIDAFVAQGPEMVSYVEQNSGVSWSIARGLFESKDPCTEYHPQWDGAVKIGRSLQPMADGQPGGGGALIDGLVSGVEGAGGEIRFETPAERLLTRQLDDGRQEVLGVRAKNKDGSEIQIRARSGVLLAAGGFDWDFDKKRRFLRGPTPYATGVPTLTGDGIDMAKAAGAKLTNMNECWGMPVYKAQAEQANKNGNPAPLTLLLEKARPGTIMVNRAGERFCNEASDYDTLWRSFFAWENWGDTGYRNIPAFVIFDNSVRKQYSIGGAGPEKSLPNWVKKAPSLKKLADALGIDPDGLDSTATQFNKHAMNLTDPEFHRGESAYDRAWSTGKDGPEATLGPVDEPPFFGAEVAVSDIGTSGGAKVNADAQVLTPFGEPVPGLYACGNNSGVGGPGAGYGGGGGTIGPGLTFAYIAAKHMTQSDS